jgi:predicted DNA-binding transcriptional regulator YafY
MSDTPARLLALLSLLQSRPLWNGTELAGRLGVTTRTIRNDVDRLRGLDYPVEATRGSAGGYRLGAGAKLPPLLLDDEEAVAVAIGLRAGRGISGLEASSARALAKLEQVLPPRLRPTVEAIATAVQHAPENTGTDAPDPEVDPAVLRAAAAAIHHVELFRFDYDDEPLLVEPYRLLAWQRRWYLVARNPSTNAWDVHRADRIVPHMRTHRRFTPVPPPDGDYTAFTMRRVASSGWNVHARLRIDAPAQSVLDRINPAVGVVEAITETTSVLATGADTVDTIAAYVGMLGMDFTVESPPELRTMLRKLADRYARA